MNNLNHRIIRSDLLRIHCEDAAFLFTLREKALEAPNYRLIDVYDLEERIRGHLSAVILADEVGAAMAADVLAENTGAGELFVAAYVVAHRTGPKGLVALIDAWDAELVHARSFVVALAWCPPDFLSAFMSPWVSSTDLRLATLALGVCAEHRVDPRQHLDLALKLEAPSIRRAGFLCAGCCGREDLKGLALDAATDEFEAAFAATLLGDRDAAPKALLASIETGPIGPYARRAAELAPLGLEMEVAQQGIHALLSTAETARWGVVAIGALGLPETLPWLVTQMQVDVLARVATDAFGTITGADMKDPELELVEFPDDPENLITEADVTEEFYDSNLPWPNIEAVSSWLNENEGRFAKGERHVYGVTAWSYNDAQLPELKYQARFRGLAYELAMRQPGAKLPNWHGQVRLENGSFGRDW